MRSAVYSAQLKQAFGADVAASIRKNLSVNLKRLMVRDRLSQREFAKGIDVNESIVSSWVNGRTFPVASNFDLIAAKYNWTYEELVREPDKVTADDVLELLKKFAKSAGYRLEKDKS